MLISEDDDFAPQEQQVAAFLGGLTKLGSAPLQAKLRVGMLTGEFRTGRHPLTGERISVPKRAYAAMGSISDILERLKGFDDYDVVMSGEGPPRIPPFPLYVSTDLQKVQVSETPAREFEVKETYAYAVRCCLRSETVSTSDGREDASIGIHVSSFGDPWTSKDRVGYFYQPSTGAIIKVPNAGCARFWIEFEFGNWLFPLINDHLNVLAPSVVDCAEISFGTSFVQGCRW